MGTQEEHSSDMYEGAASSGKSSKEKELRKLLKDRELFKTPKVIKRFMIIGYLILLMFLGSLLFFVNIEVMFGERLQQTSTYIN